MNNELVYKIKEMQKKRKLGMEMEAMNLFQLLTKKKNPVLIVRLRIYEIAKGTSVMVLSIYNAEKERDSRNSMGVQD